jgi:hypothetical protein
MAAGLHRVADAFRIEPAGGQGAEGIGGGPRVSVTSLTKPCQTRAGPARPGAIHAPGDKGMHRRRRAMRLLPIALMALFAPLSLAAQEVALDVTASEMAQPIDAARMLPGATPAAFPLPRPDDPAHRHGRARDEPAPGGARPVGGAAPALGRAFAGHGLDAGDHGRPARPGRVAGADGAAGHRRLVPGLRGRGDGAAAGVLGGAGLGARLARKHP